MQNQPFALNHITVPGMSWRAMMDLAASLGCTGVELRNDLARPLFEGAEPEEVAAYARAMNLRLLALAEVYGFNDATDDVVVSTQTLAAQARRAGAEAIVLIPKVDGSLIGFDQLCSALRILGDVLAREDMRAVIEPIGFAASSLRDFAIARRAIQETHGPKRFGVVHDTFHHHLAGGGDVNPDFVEIIHISGVAEPLQPAAMGDPDRGLVGQSDQLSSTQQFAQLRAAGCTAPASMEAFAPHVHHSNTIAHDLGISFEYVAEELEQASPAPIVSDGTAPSRAPVNHA